MDGPQRDKRMTIAGQTSSPCVQQKSGQLNVQKHDEVPALYDTKKYTVRQKRNQGKLTIPRSGILHGTG